MKSEESSPAKVSSVQKCLRLMMLLLFAAVGLDGCSSSSYPSPDNGGAKPVLSPTPSALTFGSVLLGATSKQGLSLTNSGTASLTISQISVSGSPFSITGITPPMTLSAGQVTTATVTFAPLQAGSVDGSISIVSNATNSPTLISLNGTGSAPTLQLTASPTILNFGNVMVGNNATKTVTLTNTGNASLNISQISVSGPPFMASGTSPPSTLSVGQSVTLSIAFSPTAAGAFNGSVSVLSNATDSPTLIVLTGTGMEGPHWATLLWTASTSLVAGYNAYRASEFGGSYTKLNSALITDTTYADSSVQAGQTYYYVVTALDSSDNESVYSNEVEVTIP